MSEQQIVIVGAGQAGLQAAQSLRKRGFEGRIVLLGDEAYAPYQRPPLSKAFLKGQLDESRLSFRPADFYDTQSIDLRCEQPVAAIDCGAHEVRLENGESVSYDKVIIATGSSPMPLPIPGADLDGVLELRGIDDAKTIKERLESVGRLVVIGGGYIGLEVASAARQMGLDVTVVERLSRLLPRVTSPEISQFYLELHRQHGVDVRLEESVDAIEGDGSVTGVRLASGEVIPTDAVVVGIGVRPNESLAQAAGIDCEDGVLVDDHGQTSDPDVFAAGDCTRRPMGGASIRLESVHNALDQAERIASYLTAAEDLPYDPPWFWSDQYDIKLQTAGLFAGYTECLIRGDRDGHRFSALYFRDGELIALDAINDPATFMAAKQILKSGMTVTREDLDDPSTTLKDLFVKWKKANA